MDPTRFVLDAAEPAAVTTPLLPTVSEAPGERAFAPAKPRNQDVPQPKAVSGEEAVDLTILLPAYNEEQAVGPVIQEIREALAEWPGTWELLVVDDGSQDRTAAHAAAEGARVVRRVENGGFGEACKTGLTEARGRLVALMDVDGTYVPAHLCEMLACFPDYDQVNGARTSEQGTTPWLRMPAKWMIRKLAEWISGRRIPDLNTGMRIVKRDIMLRYLWALPSGFSCSASMTLAFACNGHAVKFVPVEYRPRIGRSKFRPVRDTFSYIGTVFRLVMYFRPIRVFFPISVGLGLITFASGYYNFRHSPTGLHDTDVLLAVTALMTLMLGMLAELIVAQRR